MQEKKAGCLVKVFGMLVHNRCNHGAVTAADLYNKLGEFVNTVAAFGIVVCGFF